MKKGKVVSLLLTTALAATLLTGCGKTGTEIAGETKTKPAMEQVAVVEQVVPEKKVYQPYEHVYFQRFYNDTYTEDIYGGQIIIPEGYEILEIENVIKKAGYGSRTAGFDVWFINTKTVEVEPVYNGAYGYYDYSQAGTVLEQELEEENPSLKLTH